MSSYDNKVNSEITNTRDNEVHVSGWLWKIAAGKGVTPMVRVVLAVVAVVCITTVLIAITVYFAVRRLPEITEDESTILLAATPEINVGKTTSVIDASGRWCVMNKGDRERFS